MNTSKWFRSTGWGVVVMGCVVSTVQSAELLWQPISASGTHVVIGNEIRLTGGGQRVFLEMRLSGWAPDTLNTWQGVLDPTPLGQICVGGGNDGNACFRDFDCFGGGVCTATRPGPIGLASEPCAADSDCVAAFADTSAVCDIPSGFCKPGWQDLSRTEFVIAGGLSLVDTSTPFLRYGSAVLTGAPAIDSGGIFYGGTLALDVPVSAIGSYDVVISPSSDDTFMVSSLGLPIFPITITNAVITVLCQSNAACDDSDACTTDVCEMTGVCSHTPNYDTVSFCCTPANGNLIAIDDGNDCTIDICAADGSVSHPPRPEFAACGDSTSTTCNRPDSCNATGVCLSRFVSNGTPCGNPTVSDCDGADTCDGGGTCQPNFVAAGTACGDPSVTQCDNADTCNATGLCLSNNVTDGTFCDDGLFCNVGESCSGGLCAAGMPRNCSDGLTCTTDVCNEATNSCDSTLDANNCLISGGCFADAELNPANDCEWCDSQASTTAFTIRADGSNCGVDAPCTIDQCVSGACTHPPEPQGVPCGNPNVTECDLADSCNGAGLCASNFVPSGTACGDPSVSQCDEADTCNGSGACVANFIPNGTACNDGDDICTGPDTCRNGICSGRVIPQAPDVVGLGGLSIDITPLPQDSTAPVALRVTSPNWPCFDLYLNANGSLVSTPVFLLPSEWGTVNVTGPEIVPSSTYHVVAECGAFASSVGSGDTWLFADFNNDGLANFRDITLSVAAFLENSTLPLELMDIAPCDHDGLTNFRDITFTVGAFLEDPYPCLLPCP